MTIVEKIIKWFCEDEPKQKKGYKSYKGFTLDDTFYTLLIGDYTMHGDRFSYVFFLDDEKTMIYYCEGDITVEIFEENTRYRIYKRVVTSQYENGNRF